MTVMLGMDNRDRSLKIRPSPGRTFISYNDKSAFLWYAVSKGHFGYSMCVLKSTSSLFLPRQIFDADCIPSSYKLIEVDGTEERSIGIPHLKALSHRAATSSQFGNINPLTASVASAIV